MTAKVPWFLYRRGEALDVGAQNAGFLGDGSKYRIIDPLGAGVPYRHHVGMTPGDRPIQRIVVHGGLYSGVGQIKQTGLIQNPFVNISSDGIDEGA